MISAGAEGPGDDIGPGRHEYVELTSLGVDIGSATSHAMASRVGLARRSRTLSAKFEVVAREALWRSSVLRTPYEEHDDGSTRIHLDKLSSFLEDQFEAAGIRPEHIDSGAVILTGHALEQENARAIADHFATTSGKFVVASAGHHLEAHIAAHGSGAVKMSRDLGGDLLHLDVGGGTVKLALICRGEVTTTAALRTGSRFLVWDVDGQLRSLNPLARLAAEAADLSLRSGAPVARDAALRVARELVAGMLDAALATGPGTASLLEPQQFLLTDPLPALPPLAGVTVSGGVAEYLYEGEPESPHIDLGPVLATALRERFASDGLRAPLLRPRALLSATVIGASQSTVEVSGNTVVVSSYDVLPIRNLPVLRMDLNLAGDFTAEEVAAAITVARARLDAVQIHKGYALSLQWRGIADYERLRRLAEGIRAGVGSDWAPERPLVLLVDGDVARTLGALLRDELKPPGDIVSLDGLECSHWDYVDIGRPTGSAQVIPVVVKSLLFP